MAVHGQGAGAKKQQANQFIIEEEEGN